MNTVSTVPVKRLTVWPPKRKVHRPPLISFTEFAFEVGVPTGTLSGIFAKSPLNRPKPSVVCRSHTAYTNSYYCAKELRAWWRGVQALKESKALTC